MPAKPTVNSTLRMDPKLRAVLNAHKNVRNIKLAELIDDILHGWVERVTDWEHPYFSRELLGFSRIRGPLARYPGYIASLGFVDRTFDYSSLIDPSDGNPMRYHKDHYRPAPEDDTDAPLPVDPQELRRLRNGGSGYDNDHPGEDPDDAS